MNNWKKDLYQLDNAAINNVIAGMLILLTESFSAIAECTYVINCKAKVNFFIDQMNFIHSLVEDCQRKGCAISTANLDTYKELTARIETLANILNKK